MKKIILFQGDSITDVGRFEESTGFLGDGYVKLISEHFDSEHSNVEVINRGISGDRVIDLKARWEADCIAIQPDILTILIGINDCWRKYDSNDETAIEDFEANYENILKQAIEKTNARIILMEPFVLPTLEDRLDWRVTLDPEIQAVRRLAKKYQTDLVTLDAVFAKAAIRQEYAALAEDGVHPTLLGHELIKNAWLETYK